MTILFWLCLFLLVYPLCIYPLCLLLLRSLSKKKAPAPLQDDAHLPSVSILLSVFNEEKVMAQKIENFLALDYPAHKLELLIISDQSTDGTTDIVRQYILSTDSKRIRLICQETRGGKTKALNRAVLAADEKNTANGEILFFTDADSMMHGDALRTLMAPFADPNVGLVSGRSVYKDCAGRESTGSLYRQYEEWIKEHEGQLFGIVGADGAIYALRRDLYTELAPKIINDFAHPIHTVLAGYTALAEPRALVSEPAEDHAHAFARQTRIMAQSWHVFFTSVGPLIQAKRWGFLWQCLSHKVLRWLALVWLILLVIAAPWAQGFMPTLSLVGVFVLTLCAALGEKAKIFGRISSLFLMQSAAGLYGLYRLWQGEAFITWNPKGQ